MGCFIQMFPGFHGVKFVLVMSAFNGSILFSPNVTMLVYSYLLSLEPLKLPFGEEAFVSSRNVVLLCSLCVLCDDSIRRCECGLV